MISLYSPIFDKKIINTFLESLVYVSVSLKIEKNSSGVTTYSSVSFIDNFTNTIIDKVYSPFFDSLTYEDVLNYYDTFVSELYKYDNKFISFEENFSSSNLTCVRRKHFYKVSYNETNFSGFIEKYFKLTEAVEQEVIYYKHCCNCCKGVA